jgi:2-oxoglutarate dehydrogenase E1 component
MARRGARAVSSATFCRADHALASTRARQQDLCQGRATALGDVHIIVATPQQTRSTPYLADVAKMLQAPIFHSNVDGSEAVVHAARPAMAFRQRFKCDVMIDLWCYRRYGHNETDDPTFMQPLMYQEVAAHPSVLELYTQRLTEAGEITAEAVEQIRHEVRQRLDAAREVARQLQPRQRISTLGGVWSGLTRARSDWGAITAVAAETPRRIGEQAVRAPDCFALHPNLTPGLAAWRDMVQRSRPVDWGCAEILAFGNLLLEEIPYG